MKSYIVLILSLPKPIDITNVLLALFSRPVLTTADLVFSFGFKTKRKNSACNLKFRPPTRLVRGIYPQKCGFPRARTYVLLLISNPFRVQNRKVTKPIQLDLFAISYISFSLIFLKGFWKRYWQKIFTCWSKKFICSNTCGKWCRAW